jgi:hypothetical protein
MAWYTIRLTYARSLAAIPGLEQGTEALVPKAYLPRARGALEQQQPTDAELTELALGGSDPSER